MTKASFVRDCAPVEIITLRGDMQARVECAQCGQSQKWKIATRVPPERVRKYFLGQGWTLGRRTICPACATTKKEEPPVSQPANVTPIKPSEPTEAARIGKRLVLQALEDPTIFNDRTRCYKPGHSDESIAKMAGMAVPAVVALREEFFGKPTKPSEFAELEAELTKVSDHLELMRAAAVEQIAAIRAKMDSIAKRNGWSA